METKTYIVRIWLERVKPFPIWRSSVQEVGTDKKYYFSEPGEMSKFLVENFPAEGWNHISSNS